MWKLNGSYELDLEIILCYHCHAQLVKKKKVSVSLVQPKNKRRGYVGIRRLKGVAHGGGENFIAGSHIYKAKK